MYIDGFNLYHAVDDLGEPHLKWADYWKLGEIIIPSQTEQLVKVCYCTAYYPDDQKKWRHQQFVNAMKIKGVDVQLGHYVHEDASCRSCGSSWKKPTEKAGDINVAIHLLSDAFLDKVDHIYLITQDSDQSATAKLFKEKFPEKKFTTVAPPNRKPSSHIAKYADAKIKLTLEHIEKCVMPEILIGKPPARRPKEYSPPSGWVHPDKRP
ncbi:NYN domain-containing protein [Pontivivens nitratireducens]|uniref:NYN domain-containing protein n=1 Tax=Pontivivens nitratireducens TaxID=2758038 RepID=UPI001F10489E|nr:NYN domain-containing protein [Pontibrevibacter nitratireducens]